MRFRIKILAIILAILVLAALTAKSSAYAQDPNAPDTLYVDSVLTAKSAGIVPVLFMNDQPLAGFEVTLKYDFDPAVIVLDSFSFVGSRVDYISTKGVSMHLSDTAITIWGFPFSEPLIAPGSGPLGQLHFSYAETIDSTLITIDSATIINVDIEWSTSFSDSLSRQFSPQFVYGNLYINRDLCCIDQRGDVNNDGTDADIVDLTYLIDFAFRGGPPAECSEEANFDGDVDANVTILDLTVLVDFLFRGGPEPTSCPY